MDLISVLLPFFTSFGICAIIVKIYIDFFNYINTNNNSSRQELDDFLRKNYDIHGINRVLTITDSFVVLIL